jgi:hypothetical protein
MFKLAIVALIAILVLAVARALKRAPANPAASQPEPEPEPEVDGSFALMMKTAVVLEGNDWEACTVDGIEESWKRFASRPVRGFCALPAGRHRVATRVGGGEAILDFTIYPGEVRAFRLSGGAWSEVTGDEGESLKALAEGGDKSVIGDALIRYRSTLGIARLQQGTVKAPDAVVAEVIEALGKGQEDAGEKLVGVPLTRAQIDRLAEAAGARKDQVLPGRSSSTLAP